MVGMTPTPYVNSNNRRIREVLGWTPLEPLRKGLEQTYAWIEMQVLRDTPE